MAKQSGAVQVVGTIGGITFYQMEGRYYARKRSSLTGKQVKRDPRFGRTMQSARRLGRGSQLASKVYRSLPKAQQVYALYQELRSIAIRALKEGKSEEEVPGLLRRRLRTECAPVARQKKKPAPWPFFAPKLFCVRGGRGENALGSRRRLHSRPEVLRE